MTAIAPPATGSVASEPHDLAPPAPFPVFQVPQELIATAPPEARGLARDRVRMLVSTASTGVQRHATARDLPGFLRPGDVLVVNVSATLPAAVRTTDGGLLVHLSTPLPGTAPHEADTERVTASHASAPKDRPTCHASAPKDPPTCHASAPKDPPTWVIELRRPTGHGSAAVLGAPDVPVLALPGGGTVEVLAPFAPGPGGNGTRLWRAALRMPGGVLRFLRRHGQPIRYGTPDRVWPLSAYQTVYAREPGSAEMPSAGRPLSHEVLTRLMSRGIDVAPIVLHAGVSSQEAGEPPTPERHRVPASTADRVNVARRRGGRVIAVGTTVTRALETVTDAQGVARPGEGWTDVVVTPDRGVLGVDGLLTGWHEPGASHLAMLMAVAGSELVGQAYLEALRAGYHWHEFGDVHLLLP